MKIAPDWKTIENVVWQTYIRLLNDIGKAHRLAEKPLSVDFCVFHGQIAPPKNKQEVAAAAE